MEWAGLPLGRDENLLQFAGFHPTPAAFLALWYLLSGISQPVSQEMPAHPALAFQPEHSKLLCWHFRGVICWEVLPVQCSSKVLFPSQDWNCSSCTPAQRETCLAPSGEQVFRFCEWRRLLWCDLGGAVSYGVIPDVPHPLPRSHTESD